MRPRGLALALLRLEPVPGAAQADHPPRALRPVVPSGGGNGAGPGMAVGPVAVVDVRVPARYEGAA